MKSPRRAYALIEMLSLIAGLVILLALSVEPMRTLLADIPRTDRDFQTWVQTMDMLEHLKRDVEQSGNLSLMGDSNSSRMLSLEQSGGKIIYRLDDNQMVRQSDMPNDPFGSSRSWDLPHVQVDWSLCQKRDTAYALQVTTRSLRTVLGKSEERFAQSCVFFGNCK